MRARFRTADNPCTVCGGYERAVRGQGVRCTGYVDGEWLICSREERSGRLKPNANGGYPHRLQGPCPCGVQHGAQVRDIAESQRARIIERYAYRGLDGQTVYEAVRLDPKGFRQRRLGPAGEWIWNLQGIAPLLYRLPEVVAAVGAGDQIWIVEGERDVHALEEANQVATTNSGGAGKFPPSMAQHLAGADVTIVQDKDEPGRAHARAVLALLRPVAKSVRIVEPKVGKDARDHLEAGHGVADFVPVWPLESLRKSDPAAWKRKLLQESLVVAKAFQSVDDLPAREASDAVPQWPSGIRGVCDVTNFEGFTVLTGGPGAAKSFLAIASSLSAAMYGGWQVEYLSSELPAGIIAGRVRRFLRGSPMPDSWKLTEVGFGANIPGLIEYLCARMNAQKTLVVMDSISSFAEQGLAGSSRDPMGIADLKMLCMWIMNVRRESKGQISFLVLSEANASGGTKYRFADHKADTVLCMTKDEFDAKTVKHIEVTKGWASVPIGTKVKCRLDWNTSSLTADNAGPGDVD